MRLTVYGVGSAALLTFLVRFLLFAPLQTPFLVVSAAACEPPLPPHAWSREDVAALSDLDGETLQLIDTTPQWRSREEGLRALERQLAVVARDGRRASAVVVYITLHGTIDDAGAPCLIAQAPGVSALTPEAWLPVADVLERIRGAHLPDGTVKLVVLDSMRMRSNWPIGLLHNAFAERLGEVVDKAGVPNLYLLNSASPGERGWASPALGGSAFGHFLRRGLAGEADDESQRGDGDSRVSLRELTAYLRRQVDRWAQHNRGEHQRPMLVPGLAPETVVAWALSARDRRKLDERRAVLAPPPPAVSESEIAAGWTRLARLRAAHAERIDPIAWRDLCARLVWLDEASVAGSGYAEAARCAAGEAARLAAGLEAAAGLADASETARAPTAMPVGGLPALSPGAWHSLALAQSFAASGAAQREAVERDLDALEAEFPQRNLASVLESLDAIPAAAGFSEVQFLRLLDRYQVPLRLTAGDLLVQAVQVRRLAERAAAPEDERLTQRVRRDVDPWDNVRRAAEDATFAGLPEAALRWDQAEEQYRQALERSHRMSSVLRLRDRILSDLPSLSEWLCRLHANGEQTELVETEVRTALLSLIRGVCRLDHDAVLDGAPLQQLEIEFERLRQVYDDECRRLLVDGRTTGTNLRDILALLKVPLLSDDAEERGPAEQRMALRAMARRLDEELQRDAASASEGSSAGSAPPPEQRSYVERLYAAWPQHPAVAILEAAADRDDADAPAAGANDGPLARNAAEGARVRTLLGALRSELKAIADVAAAGDDDARQAWARGERIARVAAGLDYAPPAVNPVIELRRFDLVRLLHWHAERILDDFYGSAAPGEAPFFASAARAALEGGRLLSSERGPSRTEFSDLSTRVAERIAAAEGGLSASATTVVLIDPAVEATTTVSVAPGMGNAADGFPSGRAAVFVGSAADAPGPLPVVRLPLAGTPPQAVEARIPHSGFDEVGSGTTRNAVVLFRGHEFRAPVAIRPVGGTEVSHVPAPLDFADVLVLGPMQKHASLVFVLDCSGSMQQPLPLEGAEGARRFDAAILAVRQLLERLAEMGDARVGVILYGHRARWDHERRDQVLYQKRYSRAVPANQMPYDDVEPVLPLGRFDATIAAQVSDLLGTLEPWGETPLYLALLEAVQQFTTWDDAYDRHIVVVTDGINQQFNAPAEKRKQVQDVIAAIAGRPIAMHIVGFGIPQGQVPQARAAFDALARANRGSYMPIDDAARLLDHLQGLLGERTFTIREADGREHQSAVGSALRLENLSALVQPLQVRVDNIVETLTVQGGESLRLSPQSDGTLGAEPYLAGRPLFQPLVSGGASSGEGWLLGVHRPLRTAAQVQFEFSLQHPRGRIAPHPAEVWIEATPVLSSGERATPFTFYDREFLVGTSVPVLKAVAENWPANASRASVRAWFRFERAAPIVRVPLGEIEARKAIVVPGLPWVALHIERVGADGGELRVVEQYTAAAPEFPALRIDSSDPRTCRRIIRRFDPDQRVCVHRFELDAAPAGRDASSEMWITPRSRLQDRAWELVAPVQVDIAATEGLIVPAASR